MNKNMNRIILSIFVILAFIGSASAQNSFVILNSENVQSMLENVKYIESEGGRIVHKFPPNVLIGDIPKDKINSLIGKKNIVKITTDKVDISSVESYGDIAKIAAGAWNNNYGKSPSITPGIESKKLKPLKDVMKVPEGIKKERIARSSKEVINKEAIPPPYGAGFYDTSEYFIGDVAVGIVYLESNGAVDPNTEDWTYEEMDNVFDEIYAGLDWWATRDPKAKLSFTYNLRLFVPTSYEPITRPYYDQSLWITDAMNSMGYTTYSSYFDNVYDHNNYLRWFFGTDWAYTFFVVDSSNDADGQFSDGYSAYAYLGGPFSVLTYDNDGYGISNMDYVAAHESGHIFYATDEYNGYTEYSGYLNAHDIESSGKIMHCGLCWGISSGTALQLGWRDNDGDGVFDIIDFYPDSQLNAYSPDPTTDNTPTYTGKGYSNMVYPNNNPLGLGHDITVNRIDNVQYRVDSGPWTNALASSVFFDSAIENFVFTTSPLSGGTHKFEVRAHNDEANRWETSYSSDYLTISGGASITVTSPNGGDNWIRGTTKTITWTKTGSPGAYVKIELLKGGVVNRVISSSTSNDGSYSWYVPVTQTLGTDYKIRITSTSNSAYKDTSNNNFAIRGINVNYPNGGENWARGTTKTITWSYSGSPGANVKIELLKGGVVNRVISSSTPNDRSYSWYIPTGQTVGTDFKVRITSTSNSLYRDTSNYNFRIY